MIWQISAFLLKIKVDLPPPPPPPPPPTPKNSSVKAETNLGKEGQCTEINTVSHSICLIGENKW